jgi:hypothetical protein
MNRHVHESSREKCSSAIVALGLSPCILSVGSGVAV